MEAWAAKKSLKYKKNKVLADAASVARPLTPQQIEAINSSIGLAPAPQVVYAVAKFGSCAGVWWAYEDDAGITGWEVCRYRRKLKGEWIYTGKMQLPILTRKQAIIKDLSDGHEYHFTVRARNTEGLSVESPCSNIIYIDPPPPPGWERDYHTKSGRYLYCNRRTGQCLWSRPDADRYYVEECIAQHFREAEIEHLKELYDEEMAHFEMVSVHRFVDVLQECGVNLDIRSIVKIFKGYTGSETELRCWRDFMNVITHVKLEMQEPKIILPVTPPKWWEDLLASRKALAPRIPDKEIDDWIIRWCAINEKYFYINTDTNVVMWTMPEELQFHLTPIREEKLLMAFDFGHLELFRMQFRLLDKNRSGALSESDIGRFLSAVNVSSDIISLKMFFHDLDRNATKKKKSGIWEKLEELELLNVLLERGPIVVSDAPPPEEVVEKKSPLNRVLDKVMCDINRKSRERAALEYAAMKKRMLEKMYGRKPGPHGYYCLCGCKYIDKFGNVVVQDEE